MSNGYGTAGAASGAAPGWYPEPTGAPFLRWWDGYRWSEHIVPAYGPPRQLERRPLPAGSRIYSVFIWVVAALPFLTTPVLVFWNPVASLQRIAESGGTSENVSFSIVGPMYFILLAISWGALGLAVVFAYLDWRYLVRIGVIRPFHWAWTFLNPGVYVVGRSVIVRRVARPRGLAPIWLFAGLYAATLITVVVWFIAIFSSALGQTGGYTSPSGM